jgi:uncharacterized protein (DUF433 family)
MASLDWSQCPAVERIPGKVGGAWVFRDTRMPVSIRDRLERHLDYMASQVTAETTPDEMEAAISDALASVRPQRSWRP